MTLVKGLGESILGKGETTGMSLSTILTASIITETTSKFSATKFNSLDLDWSKKLSTVPL